MARDKASRLIKKRMRVLDSAPDTLSDAMPGVEKKLYNQLKDLVLMLDIVEGRLVFSDKTAQTINKIEQKIRQSIKGSGYVDSVSEYLTSFDQINELSSEYFNTANGIKRLGVGINRLQKVTVDQVTYSLLENGLDARFTQPIKDLLTAGATSGQSVIEVRGILRKFIEGSDGKLGFFERYVPQIAHDAISQYDGAIQTRVKNKYNFNAWSYEGSLIDDSRPQCIRWVEMGVIKDSQLSKEIEWAFTNGSGMIPQTTPETFGIYRGGYRCRHHATAIPV